jgi:hypothetical protein
MAVDPRRRQKKLMKRRRKDKQRKKRSIQEAFYASSPDPRLKVKAARGYPIFDCLINADWKDRGLATILLARKQPNGKVTFGCYLVDIYCLGLKNTFCNIDFTPARYRTEVVVECFQDQQPVSCPPALAHQIVYGAIDYAAQFGFRPEKDFDRSQYVLDARDEVPAPDDLEFGHNGKPLFVAGPHDDVERIVAQLEQAVGKDGHHFIAPFADDWQ